MQLQGQYGTVDWLVFKL